MNQQQQKHLRDVKCPNCDKVTNMLNHGGVHGCAAGIFHKVWCQHCNIELQIRTHDGNSKPLDHYEVY